MFLQLLSITCNLSKLYTRKKSTVTYRTVSIALRASIVFEDHICINITDVSIRVLFINSFIYYTHIHEMERYTIRE
jgi:hypothetical protein